MFTCALPYPIGATVGMHVILRHVTYQNNSPLRLLSRFCPTRLIFALARSVEFLLGDQRAGLQRDGLDFGQLRRVLRLLPQRALPRTSRPAQGICRSQLVFSLAELPCDCHAQDDRPMSTTADATHLAACTGSVEVGNCVIEGQGDDG